MGFPSYKYVIILVGAKFAVAIEYTLPPPHKNNNWFAKNFPLAQYSHSRSKIRVTEIKSPPDILADWLLFMNELSEEQDTVLLLLSFGPN